MYSSLWRCTQKGMRGVGTRAEKVGNTREGRDDSLKGPSGLGCLLVAFRLMERNDNTKASLP